MVRIAQIIQLSFMYLAEYKNISKNVLTKQLGICIIYILSILTELFSAIEKNDMAGKCSLHAGYDFEMTTKRII